MEQGQSSACGSVTSQVQKARVHGTIIVVVTEITKNGNVQNYLI